jgi:hypothetical protein
MQRQRQLATCFDHWRRIRGRIALVSRLVAVESRLNRTGVLGNDCFRSSITDIDLLGSP